MPNFTLQLFIPVALASGFLGWGATPTFCFNMVSLIPLALILGDVTEGESTTHESFPFTLAVSHNMSILTITR